MWLAEAELTQATVYARAGEVDQAMTKADEAFSRARRSLPSILLVGHEVAGVMRRTRPESVATADFAEHLRALEKVA
jgi:hypothetical protein